MKGNHFGRWIAWVAALALTALACAGIVWSEQRYTMRTERLRMEEQTRVISQNLVRQLGAVRSVLGNIASTWTTRSDACDKRCRRDAVHALREAMPGVRAVALLDRDGRLLFRDGANASPSISGMRLAPVLQVARKPGVLYLSTSVQEKTGRTDVNAALSVAASTGATGGLLVALLDPAYFDVVMRSALYSPDMTSTVATDGGAKLLFAPYEENPPPYDARGHAALYERHLQSGLRSTVMTGKLGLAGEVRIVAQRSVEADSLVLDDALVVSVTRSLDAVAAPWRRLAWESFAAWAALAVIGTAMLHVRQRRQHWMDQIDLRRQAESEAAARKIELALAGANLGLWEWRIDGDRLELDRRGLAMLGYAASEGSEAANKWLDQVHPEDRSGVEQALLQTDVLEADFEVEYRIRHRRGHWLWVLSRGKVIERDDAGRPVRLAGTRMDIGMRKQAEADIAQLAFYDALTGLPNRRLLLDRLDLALAKSARSKLFGAVLFIDLDNFKKINDTLGHQKGDMLLTRVAIRLKEVTRGVDTVARFGGDEFVVLLDDLGSTRADARAHAALVASKIVGTLALPHALDGDEVCSTPSVGITMFGAGAHALDDLLKQADMAMYEVKAAGRNDYRFFDPAMQAGIANEAALESELRRALASHALTLFYQPVLDRRGAMQGVEALVRWHHPLRGIVGPAEFISQAEKSELIVDIGNRVLALACRQLVEWGHRENTRQLTVAVNISARQARHPDFVEQVSRVLAQTGADPALLKLELTESMLLGCVNEMIQKMKALNQLGVRFALDDFGTGYSSLSYLERLPIAQIKIDRSFVGDMLVTPNAATITRAIITLGHNLGLEIVAEGVESNEQRLALMDYGCHRFQGFLFSAPIPADEIERWLTESALKCSAVC